MLRRPSQSVRKNLILSIPRCYFNWPSDKLGVDIICAQGGEGGGHTGDTPFSVLIPATVDLCKGRKSPLTGEDIIVVAAGGIADGRGLAASLSCVHFKLASASSQYITSYEDMVLRVSGSEHASSLALKPALPLNTKNWLSVLVTMIRSALSSIAADPWVFERHLMYSIGIYFFPAR